MIGCCRYGPSSSTCSSKRHLISAHERGARPTTVLCSVSAMLSSQDDRMRKQTREPFVMVSATKTPGRDSGRHGQERRAQAIRCIRWDCYSRVQAAHHHGMARLVRTCKPGPYPLRFRLAAYQTHDTSIGTAPCHKNWYCRILARHIGGAS